MRANKGRAALCPGPGNSSIFLPGSGTFLLRAEGAGAFRPLNATNQ